MDLAAEQAAVFSAAAADITSGKCSIRKAAIHYGINVSKLHRVIQGRQGADANRGAPSSLPRIADNKLVEKLVLLICNNRYLSRVNLSILAREICISLGIKRTKRGPRHQGQRVAHLLLRRLLLYQGRQGAPTAPRCKGQVHPY